MCRPASDFDNDIQVPVNAAGYISAIRAQHATDDELANSHSKRAEDEEGPAASLVDEEEDDAGEDYEEGRIGRPRK